MPVQNSKKIIPSLNFIKELGICLSFSQARVTSMGSLSQVSEGEATFSLSLEKKLSVIFS